MMDYQYGTFSDEQVKTNAKLVHSKVHKLLVYKDDRVEEKLFANDNEFMAYFRNLLDMIGGMNSLFGEPDLMISFMSTLQAAYDLCGSEEYSFSRFRRLILDAHGLLQQMFGEVR